ncbi:DMT family transporter [Bosea sp. 685]|uniref:DMT family transporter n=1 Tax=Bosea sp. 685 TaxID=3080057 RepID=UPI0028932373|nr:DMT family transporter [Bosea sp. 685]WNJ90555.1 DMT family transporter [Bosea sp. 685]
MSEERLTGRQDRSGFDDDVSDASFRPLHADEPPAEAAPPIVLSAISKVTAPAQRGWIARLRHGLAHRWLTASPNLRGSVYMLSSLLVYAVMVGAMKHVGAAIPLIEILMIRQIIMSLVIVAIAGSALPMLMRTTRPGLQITRGLITLASMLCGFSAVIHIPLAQATAIGFSQVFFVTIAAVLVLKEKVDSRRWIATIIGFAGVMIMLDPSAGGLNIYALASIAGALFGAGVTVSVRMLAATERTETILLYQGVVLMAVLAVPCWWFWIQPSPKQWFWLVVLSLFGTAGQWLLTRAYQVGEAAALAPLDFTRLILSCFTGFVFFAEIPALTTGIGAAIVIGATLYTIRKNARPVLAPSPPGPLT